MCVESRTAYIKFVEEASLKMALPSIREALKRKDAKPTRGASHQGICRSSLSLSQPSRRAPKERPEMFGISDGNLEKIFTGAVGNWPLHSLPPKANKDITAQL